MEPGWLELEAEQKARTAYAHERCILMESALRQVGFSKGTQTWEAAVLIAKICHGWNPLERDIDILATDRDFPSKTKDIEHRKRTFKRAIEELKKFNLIDFEFANHETRRRTRPSRCVKITIDPRRLHAIANGVEIRTTAGQRTDNGPDIEPDIEPDNDRTTDGQFQDHSLLYSLSQDPFIPPSPNDMQTVATAAKVDPWEEVGRELRHCGKVDRWKAAISEANKQGLTPGELRDAIYVLKHTADLSGGALFDWIRSGSWPVNRVRTSEAIREQRRKAAEIVRRSVCEEAESRSPKPSDWSILCVCFKRLTERKLDDQVTHEERAAHERYQNGQPR